jgi:hypothetical protein
MFCPFLEDQNYTFNPSYFPGSGHDVDFEHTYMYEPSNARLAHELSHAYDQMTGQSYGHPYTDQNGQNRCQPGEQRAIRDENTVKFFYIGPLGPDQSPIRTRDGKYGTVPPPLYYQ